MLRWLLENFNYKGKIKQETSFKEDEDKAVFLRRFINDKGLIDSKREDL